MEQETHNNSKLPIVLTRRPRHYLKARDWEIEFSLEEPDKNQAQKRPAARMLILGTALERMERTRTELQQRSWIIIRLEGLEGLLRELNTLAVVCLVVENTGAVSGLAVRALHDFILAVDGALSGEHAAVFESMRDVMEIELLIREFQNERHRIREWIESDNNALKRKFAPGVLRQLHATRVGLKPKDLPEHADYKAHSIGVHVTPFGGIPPFGTRDMITDCSDPFAVNACFCDIFRHAKSFLTRLLEFMSIDPSSHFEKTARLKRFVRVHTAVEKAQMFYYGILEAIDRQLQRVPDGDDLMLDIEIDVVPEGYKTVFRDLCEDRPLKAKVFFRPQSPAQSHEKSK